MKVKVRCSKFECREDIHFKTKPRPAASGWDLKPRPVFFAPALNFTVPEPNPLHPSCFVLAKPVVSNYRNLVVSRVFLVSLYSFLKKPKLKGNVYDNIVGGLKIILPNALENFYQNF